MDPEEVRLAVYRSFAETGRPPVAGSLDERALHELHDERHIVLGPDGEIVMAHPFSAAPLGFSVMGRETLWCGARRCGGAAAPGTRSHCRTCCPTSPTCSWRRAAPAATAPSPGWSGVMRRLLEMRSWSEAKDYFRSVGLRGPFWGL